MRALARTTPALGAALALAGSSPTPADVIGPGAEGTTGIAGHPPRGCPEGLPRRAYLGLVGRALTTPNALRLGLEEREGVWIQTIAGRSPAAAAGLRVDDVIVSVGGQSTPDPMTFLDALGRFAAGDEVSMRVVSDRRTIEHVVHLTEAPIEWRDGLDVTLDAFGVSRGDAEYCLRAIHVRPSGETPTRWVLLIQDAMDRSVESGGYNLFRELAFRLATDGFGVVRYDRPGVGDSAGPSYLDQGFEADVADALAAFDHVRARHPDAECFVVGHVVGGVVAARVAEGRSDVAGVVLSAPLGRSFPEFVAAGARRSASLAGASDHDVDALGDAIRAFYAGVLDGRPIEDVLDEHPDWRPLVLDAAGRTRGRNETYVRELADVDLDRLYGALTGRVAVVIGSSDFVSSTEDAERVHEWLPDPGAATLMVLPDTDHLFAWADADSTAFANWRQGMFLFNPATIDSLTRWVASRE